MADSYIYTLIEASTLSATDYTVVDTYVNSLSGYVTKKSHLHTIAATISSSIVAPLTSWLPINYWNNTHEVVSTLSASWMLSGSNTTIPSLSDMFNSMSISALNAPVTATADFMLVTIGDQRRSIKLWAY